MRGRWSLVTSWGWGEGSGRCSVLLWYHPPAKDFWTRPEHSALTQDLPCFGEEQWGWGMVWEYREALGLLCPTVCPHLPLFLRSCENVMVKCTWNHIIMVSMLLIFYYRVVYSGYWLDSSAIYLLCGLAVIEPLWALVSLICKMGMRSTCWGCCRDQIKYVKCLNFVVCASEEAGQFGYSKAPKTRTSAKYFESLEHPLIIWLGSLLISSTALNRSLNETQFCVCIITV